MNNKILISIAFICLVVIISASAYFILAKNNENNIIRDNETNSVPNNENEISDEKKGDEDMNQNNKIAVIYFSATGTTKTVAGYIQEATNGDMIEIVPKNKYTDSDLNYNNNNSRANKEQNDDSSRPEIANQIDISSYDTIYLGFPIWWGDVPKIILSFLDNYDLSRKTVIPFCTSHSSGISNSINTLKNYNKNINWVDGKKFTTSSKNEINNWAKFGGK